ncbi:MULTISPECIES: TetR/AcrR family transcriptional regulator [unclassified Streptomyces]|uniref:TetR/AcrR family transcriptional regulator n=1 Tax=unclassified Streptomyces TaxID=2593676 RepID=UPI002286918E|nr:TetR/AcrR family transcriptional regulator [Streptomyces sp. Je 1-369]WAL98516.1 TetR/AcrR family transcriptional regulator [Streptomyces sp. Je 1-369]
MARPREFDEDRVVTAAMETFWRHGYEATSTRDLCDSTGLGPSSLYNTFGGKRQLYLRALRRYHDTATAEQVEILRGDGPAKERLRAMMMHAVDADLDETGTRGCFAVNAAMEAAGFDPEVREAVRRSFDRVEDELCAVVEAGRGAGEIRATGDARVVARRVQSTYYGLRVLSRVQDDREVLLATVDGALADL